MLLPVGQNPRIPSCLPRPALAKANATRPLVNSGGPEIVIVATYSFDCGLKDHPRWVFFAELLEPLENIDVQFRPLGFSKILISDREKDVVHELNPDRPIWRSSVHHNRIEVPATYVKRVVVNH
jgi:hypothetical protein